jgi:diketogulonate reductase-like aldo/keto reductase
MTTSPPPTAPNNVSRREALALLACGALVPAAIGRAAGSAAPRTSMITRPIPSTREPLPVIGMGTWQTFDVAAAGARKPLEEVLSLFVALGGRVLDSSPMYGRSEEVAGDLAVKLGLRERLFVATKVWTSGRSEGIAQMEDSERKLRGRIDLMQVHNLVDAGTHLQTLKEWKAAKRIRYIGVTHYTAGAYPALESAIRRGGIDFVQLNYSLAEREAERTLLPLCQEHGIAVLVNRPFGAGSLFRDVRSKALPPFAKELGCTSWAELFLKFVVSHPAVTCAIPATSNPDHLRENMKAGTGVLPDAAMRNRIVEAVG